VNRKQNAVRSQGTSLIFVAGSGLLRNVTSEARRKSKMKIKIRKRSKSKSQIKITNTSSAGSGHSMDDPSLSPDLALNPLPNPNLHPDLSLRSDRKIR
jgi:hypothetical protein